MVRDEEELDTFAKRGCEELTFAFKELWFELVSNSNGYKKRILGSISYMINGVSAAKFLTSIVKITCEGGVCCFVQPPIKIAYERLENMYCDRIARSWEVCFAPNAYRYLKITSQRESAARNDSIPHSAWKQLISLTKAWSLRNERLRVGGGRIRGEKETRLYRAHLADCESRFNYIAEDLKNCEAEGRKSQIFSLFSLPIFALMRATANLISFFQTNVGL